MMKLRCQMRTLVSTKDNICIYLFIYLNMYVFIIILDKQKHTY